ncbi:MAG: sugar transferase [Solirubrobacteraceae bacterium]
MAISTRDDCQKSSFGAVSESAEGFEPRSAGQIRLTRTVKRTLDMVIAAVLLVAVLPLLVLVVIAIELESPGTPFYRARRVGYRGRPLDVLKFRKMRTHAQGLPLTIEGDSRLTRVGEIMARTRIDELPQLWNVLVGEMSLVGPRPEDPRFVNLHAADYERILEVRPGITGWSQLAFAAESRILDPTDPVGHYVDSILPAKVRLDCKYAERMRVRRDLAVMLWTASMMLGRIEVAVHRESGRLGRRRRRRPLRIEPPMLVAATLGADHEPTMAESMVA